MTSFTQSVFISKVLDGDTFVTSQGKRIRVANVNAPELYAYNGLKAKRFAEYLLLGKRVTIKSHATDKWGRLICSVYVGNKNYAYELKKNGLTM